MFKKQNIADNRIILFIVIICFATSMVVNYAINSMMDTELSLAIQSDLDSVLQYKKLAINNYNKTNLEQMAIIANSIPSTYNDPVLISSFLSKHKPFITMSDLYFASLNGEGISSNGDIVDFSTNDSFNYVLETQKPTSAISDLSTIDNGKMELGVPVISGGQLKGVLLGINHVNNVLDDLTNEAHAFTYTIITDSSGNVLISSSDEFIPLEVIASDEVTFTNDYSFEGLMHDVNNSIAGTSQFEYDGVSKIIQYTPLDFNDLMLVVIANEYDMQVGIRTISNTLTQVSFIIFLLISALSVYILLTKRNSILAIEKVAYYDELTKLPNLSKLKKDMGVVLSKNKDKKHAIIKVDVNNFKSINEIYGFEIGNRVLCSFKEISDMVEEKSLIVARVGIDEFIFFAGNNFLEELDSQTAYYESFFKEFIPELENHHLTFTYGRYFIEPYETDVDEIYNRVNLAHKMARTKEDSIIWNYDDEYKQKVLKNATLESKMKNALINNEFCAFLQPKFEIKTKKLIGAEALVRWIQPDGKMIFPDEFIPLFESNGFIIELDKFILNSVCKRLGQWKESGHDYIPISVNFSRHHLDNLNFVKDIASIVDKYSIPHKFIEIEVTESTALSNELTFKKLIEDLHSSEFKISIDDFGTGYSSLGLLKEFKMDILKLDRSFINSTVEHERRDLIVDGIVKLAHSLDMNIIAEGVEDKVQAAFLSSINCEAAQGYYYAKPMPIPEFEQKFINSNDYVQNLKDIDSN